MELQVFKNIQEELIDEINYVDKQLLRPDLRKFIVAERKELMKEMRHDLKKYKDAAKSAKVKPSEKLINQVIQKIKDLEHANQFTTT